MTWGSGAVHIGHKFGQSQWNNVSSAETYLFLYRQLTHDHRIDPITAVDVLESAFEAAVDEVDVAP